jgi:hypothetical protein
MYSKQILISSLYDVTLSILINLSDRTFNLHLSLSLYIYKSAFGLIFSERP